MPNKSYDVILDVTRGQVYRVTANSPEEAQEIAHTRGMRLPNPPDDTIVVPREVAESPSRPFKVMWEIEVDARDAHEAALLALMIQRSPNSSAVVFDTVDDRGLASRVDLLALAEEEEAA